MSPPSTCSSRLMQRRSVDLPEPEGPRMAMTSPRETSSEMPRSTSCLPKCLWRSWISRSGAAAVISVAPPAEREESGKARTLGARAVVRVVALFEPGLAKAGDGGEDQVPDRGHDQPLEVLQTGRVLQLRNEEK